MGLKKTQHATDEFFARLDQISDNIQLGMNCTLEYWQDNESDVGGRFYLQISCQRPDTVTGVMGTGYSGKTYLSPHMSDSEIVQAAFGLFKGYWEHEAREAFKWRGRRVFGPHMDVNAVWEVANKLDLRPEQRLAASK